MSEPTTLSPLAGLDLASTPIRDLVDADPRTLEILAPFGIDLCCGGAHPLGEALDLHGIEREPVLARLSEIASGQRA